VKAELPVMTVLYEVIEIEELGIEYAEEELLLDDEMISEDEEEDSAREDELLVVGVQALTKATRTKRNGNLP